MKKLTFLLFIPSLLLGQAVERDWSDTDLTVGNVTVTGVIAGLAELEFESVAQMENFDFTTIADGSRVKVNGYYANDGNFGPDIFWIAASTATRDGLSVFKPSSPAGEGRLVRTFFEPINVKWAGALGDDDWNTPVNDDSDEIEAATIYASANNLPVFFPGGIYRITRQILKSAGDETPVVKTFKWFTDFNGKQNQFIEEDPSNLEKIRTAIIFDGSADTDWLFRALDYGAGTGGNYYYGPYEIYGLVFRLDQGNGFQFGGFDDSGSYDADTNAPFCFGVRISDSYFSGLTNCITLDASNELLERTTDQTFIELVRGYECELENLAVRGGSYQIKYKGCDNLKIERVRSQQGYMPLLGLSSNAVMASVNNFQFEGFHGAGFYLQDAKLEQCRFENGYGDGTPYKVNRYLATKAATDVDASITAGAQYIDLTNLGANEPSDFFEPYMVVTIDDGTREYDMLVTAVDDGNDRLTFANYDSYSRFNATITNADIYRHLGTLGILGEDTVTMTDCNGSFNNNGSDSIDNNPQFFIIPGKQPHTIQGYSTGLGDNIKYSNRIAIVAHSYGKQFDLYGGLNYTGSSPHIAPDSDHPLVNFSGMAIHQDLANARSDYTVNPQLGQNYWLITPKNAISVDNSSANTYFEQVDGIWCWSKHAATNIDLSPQFPEFPEGAGVWEVEVKARTVSGSSTTNIRIRNTTPTSNDIITSASVDTNWKIFNGIIIDPVALNEGASRKFIEIAGPAAMYVQYVKFRKIQGVSYLAGETITAGNICQFKSDSKVWLADASVVGTSKGKLLLAMEDVTTGANGFFMDQGLWIDSGLTVGSEYFLSETAGGITTTAPSATSTIKRVVGYALSATSFSFEPEKSYYTNP